MPGPGTGTGTGPRPGRRFRNTALAGMCVSGQECTGKERSANEYQNTLWLDIFINCFECDSIRTFQKGINLFFVFIIILVANYHSCDGTVS